MERGNAASLPLRSGDVRPAISYSSQRPPRNHLLGPGPGVPLRRTHPPDFHQVRLLPTHQGPLSLGGIAASAVPELRRKKMEGLTPLGGGKRRVLMGSIIVKTKFNDSGKRKLTTPLSDERVCRPANRRWKQARQAADEELNRRLPIMDQSFQTSLSDRLSRCVADSTTTIQEKSRIVKLLAEGMLNTYARGGFALKLHVESKAIALNQKTLELDTPLQGDLRRRDEEGKTRRTEI